MLTQEDIQKIIDAQKEVFYSKEELDKKFDGVTSSFSVLQTAVDKIVSKDKTEVEEGVTVAYRMKNAENWIDKAAPKLDLEFKH